MTMPRRIFFCNRFSRARIPFPYLCGAGVALKICQALQGMDGVEKRLDLAAIAEAVYIPTQGETDG